MQRLTWILSAEFYVRTVRCVTPSTNCEEKLASEGSLQWEHFAPRMSACRSTIYVPFLERLPASRAAVAGLQATLKVTAEYARNQPPSACVILHFQITSGMERTAIRRSGKHRGYSDPPWCSTHISHVIRTSTGTTTHTHTQKSHTGRRGTFRTGIMVYIHTIIPNSAAFLGMPRSVNPHPLASGILFHQRAFPQWLPISDQKLRLMPRLLGMLSWFFVSKRILPHWINTTCLHAMWNILKLNCIRLNYIGGASLPSRGPVFTGVGISGNGVRSVKWGPLCFPHGLSSEATVH